MKQKSLIVYLLVLALLSAGFVAGMLQARQYGAFLAQGYMLLPAVAALLTRAFFDPQRFSDANLSRGRWADYLKFWLLSLGISLLVFVVYTIVGAGRWDFSGQAFLARLSEQFAATGQDLASATPAGMTPQIMLWLFFVGGLTTFNILPGLITGFGEEFGWRGLMFPRLYAIRPWLAFLVGGLIWYVWHLPLMLIAPQQNDPQTLVILIPLLALGSICTHTYLAFVYLKTRSVFVAALAHIAMNNAQASLSYLFVVDNILLANIGLVLVMVIIIAVLAVTGQFTVFANSFERTVQADVVPSKMCRFCFVPGWVAGIRCCCPAFIQHALKGGSRLSVVSSTKMSWESSPRTFFSTGPAVHQPWIWLLCLANGLNCISNGDTGILWLSAVRENELRSTRSRFLWPGADAGGRLAIP